jgi:hypothetical protein
VIKLDTKVATDLTVEEKRRLVIEAKSKGVKLAELARDILRAYANRNVPAVQTSVPTKVDPTEAKLDLQRATFEVTRAPKKLCPACRSIKLIPTCTTCGGTGTVAI